MDDSNLSDLEAELDRIGQPWQAKEAPFSDFGEDQKRALLRNH